MFKKKSRPENSDPGPRRRIFAVAGLVAVAVVVLLGLGFVAESQLRALWASDGAQSDSAALAMESGLPSPRRADLVVMPFDAMIVNIAATTGSELQPHRYMRLSLALVYDQTKDAEGQVETRHIYMRDAFQDYLRHLTTRDIEGTLGLATVRSELLRRARAIAGSDAPHEILVMELVVQ